MGNLYYLKSVEWVGWPGLLVLLVAALSLRAVAGRRSKAAESSSTIPMLGDLIPYLSNTYLYMTDMRTFYSRARSLLYRTNILGFYLGFTKVYFVTGSQNVQAMFRTSTNIGTENFMIRIMDNLWAASQEDLAKFVNDKSGRLKIPARGTEGVAEKDRYWANLHHVVHENLSRTEETNILGALYQKHFAQRLESFPAGEWRSVKLLEFFRKEMAEAAIVCLAGTRIMELSPDLLKLMWDFDEVAVSLAWGLPRWLNSEAWRRRDRFLAACGKFLEAGWANLDWDSPAAHADWEENFGSRYIRGLAKWIKDNGLAPITGSGIVAINGVFGSNANTIPIATWGVMELARDRELLEAVREEVATAYVTDPKTGARILDAQQIAALPLLQAIYTELLRLHISINITREVVEPTSLSGYKLEPGALLQAPTELAHYAETSWGADGHSASDFWPQRHIQYEESVDAAGKVTKAPKFSLAGRSNEYFPFGGGVSICPGRHFAKQEIMLTLAMIVSRFDIEFVEWTYLGGGRSDRPAQNDVRWEGAASVPPDRDMTVRWKRLW